MTPRAPAMTPEARRASIVAATIPLLREKGRALSTREIATAAGIAEGTIFRVFETKDELVHACVHEAFDTTGLCAELATIDRGTPLRERLAAAVAVMQAHLEGLFALMSILQSTGQPMHRPTGAEAGRRRERETAQLDAAFVDLVGADAARLRLPVTQVIGYLRMLTLSSVHPMLDGDPATAHELVDVILDGTLVRGDDLGRAAGATGTGEASCC